MGRIWLLALVSVACLGTTAIAQRNAVTAALDSPIKMEAEAYDANEVIVCSLALPASAALFGTDYDEATQRFIQNELFSPFRIFEFDEACLLAGTSSWTTAGVVGSTLTGIGYPNATNGTTYWACDPFGAASVTEYQIGTGVATGNTFSTPAGGSVWGSLVVDSNQAGEVMCINEIVLDSTTCVDATAGGSVLCFYPNADNAGGGGAFGNGTSDAVAPEDCSGQTLVNTSGTITEGQVTRAGQYDCSGNDPACTDRWSFAITGSTFINGIAEFMASGGERNMMCADNVMSVVFHLAQPLGIGDCQAIDADMDLVWVNGSQGGSSFNVNVNTAGTLSVGVHKTGSGNGRFVHHMNAGIPSAATVGPLFDLGNECFPFVGGFPVVIENNVGKTDLVGPSFYFGARQSDPGKSPIFLPSLTQIYVDTANLGVGSRWTHQLIALNGAASSSKGGSLSNGVLMTMF